MDDNIDDIKKIVKRLNDRMSEIVLAFYTLKTLLMSRNVRILGKKEAEENADIENQHSYFFKIVEVTLINFVIINLYKFFDKSKGNLSFYTLARLLLKHKYMDNIEKNKIEKIIKGCEDKMNKVKEARHNLFAHENINKVIESYSAPKLPSLENIELLINAVQEIFNKLSAKFNETEATWEFLKNRAEDNTKFLIKNLKTAKKVRIERIKKKLK